MSEAELTRQQLCAAMQVSESTVRRWELDGLPYTPIGARGKRYDIGETKRWLRNRQCHTGQTSKGASMSASWSGADGFIAACRKAQLRVMPSS